MAPLGKLEKGSHRLVGGQLCGHGRFPQLVQVAVKALPEGAAPAKSSIFLKKIWSQQGRQYGFALWAKWDWPLGTCSEGTASACISIKKAFLPIELEA